MSDNKVFILSWDSAWSGQGVVGVYSQRDLAEAEIVKAALRGISLSNVKIEEHGVISPVDPKDPLQYPDVIGELLNLRKIQAIKNLRAKVDGLLLAEAKRLVESVDLGALTPAQREAALAAVPPTPQERERYSLAHCWHDYDILVDGRGSKWGRIDEDLYVVLPYGWYDTDPLPYKDEFRTTLSEDEIRETYGVDSGYDL